MATLGVYNQCFFLILYLNIIFYFDFYFNRRGFSLADALDILLNDDIDGEIFIEPPDARVETDEDSGDDDGIR